MRISFPADILSIVPKVFQFTRSQEQIRLRLQWHYLQRRPEKAEDLQESVRQQLPHTAALRGEGQNANLSVGLYFLSGTAELIRVWFDLMTEVTTARSTNNNAEWIFLFLFSTVNILKMLRFKNQPCFDPPHLPQSYCWSHCELLWLCGISGRCERVRAENISPSFWGCQGLDKSCLNFTLCKMPCVNSRPWPEYSDLVRQTPAGAAHPSPWDVHWQGWR